MTRAGAGAAAAAAAEAGERRRRSRESGSCWPELLLPAGDFPAWAPSPRTSLRPPRTMGDKGTR